MKHFPPFAGQQPKRSLQLHARLKVWYADTRKTATPQPGGWLKR